MSSSVKRSSINVTGTSVVIILEMETADDAVRFVDAFVKDRKLAFQLEGNVVVNDNR